MSPGSKELVLVALESIRGDDLERAKQSFSGMTAAQMQEQHGQSGSTRQQVLDYYQSRANRIDMAIAEVKATA